MPVIIIRISSLIDLWRLRILRDESHAERLHYYYYYYTVSLVPQTGGGIQQWDRL